MKKMNFTSKTVALLLASFAAVFILGLGIGKATVVTTNAADTTTTTKVEKPLPFEDIVDLIDHNDTLYYIDGSEVPVIYLTDGRVIDNNGFECVGIADGTYQMHDGLNAYQFNPSTTTLQEFLGDK